MHFDAVISALHLIIKLQSVQVIIKYYILYANNILLNAHMCALPFDYHIAINEEL